MPSLLNNLDLSLEEKDKISSYIELLYKFDKSKRLIGSQDKSTWVVNNVEDSILACKLFEKADLYIDMGSGNGLPGVILSILNPESSVILIDIDKKKCEFLKTVCYRLGLGASVMNSSIIGFETKNVPRRTSFIYRAFSPKELALDFIRDNGDFNHLVFLSQAQEFDISPKKIIKYELSSGVCRKIAKI